MLKRKLLSSLASVLSVIATSNVSLASGWMLYEPDVPECLKK